MHYSELEVVTITSLLKKMEEAKPKKNSYMFEHSYKAAFHTYYECLRVLSRELCAFCDKREQCELKDTKTCYGKNFNNKEN